jgi:glutamyl endopeptidase
MLSENMLQMRVAEETEVQSGHTSVSNQPDDSDFEVGELVSTPPSTGSATESTPYQPEDDGPEMVDGVPNFEGANVLFAPSITGLRDIGEASYGTAPAGAETVHLPDDRVQITNTSVYPWCVHASLLITAADNSMWIGTGWFVGPHTLITAGHVVYIKNSGVPGRDGWVRQIRVMPGRNGNTLPYGAVTSSNFRTVNGWAQNGDPNFDYGAIILPTNLGNTVGWLGFGVYSDADLLQTVGNISGYPGDKPAGTQWYASRRIASVTSHKVYYDIDTAGGQSGSAVYRIKNGGRYAFAIHAYGGTTVNSGTRINTPVYNNILAWRA